MVLKHTPDVDRDMDLPQFNLPAIDGQNYSREDVAGENGTLVIFICNHCPYVIGIADRLNKELMAVKKLGIGVIAINANDAMNYPEDSFEKMKPFAEKYGFEFPYAYDESQKVAHSFGAVCTPDFFGFNKDGQLRYRGRLDSAGKDSADSQTVRELYNAMKEMAETGDITQKQTPSMGCSIKWK